jgi:hypothetical protein
MSLYFIKNNFVGDIMIIKENSPEKIKRIMATLNKINQIFKNLIDDTDIIAEDSSEFNNVYEINNGCVYACGKYRNPQLVIGNILEDEDNFFINKFFTIQGKDLFDYGPVELSKETKENLIKEIIYDTETNRIEFSRGYNSIAFEYKPINTDNYNLIFDEKLSKFNTPIIEDIQVSEEVLQELINETDQNVSLIINVEDVQTTVNGISKQFSKGVYVTDYLTNSIKDDLSNYLNSYIRLYINNNGLIGNKVTTKK